MKIEITETKEVEVKFIAVRAGVRYWEDATVNGEEDTEGSLIPFRKGDCWEPVIEIETGIIKQWPDGVTADIHYKVCDNGVYFLLDSECISVKEISGYVPKIMCPNDKGYGDYIIMKVDGTGQIENWWTNLPLSEFEV